MLPREPPRHQVVPARAPSAACVTPVNIRLDCPIAEISIIAIAAVTSRFAAPEFPSAVRIVCGIGEMKFTLPLPTNATTELVPNMNMEQITGDATTTLRLTVRAGALLSPARIATYSRPALRAKHHLRKDRKEKQIEHRLQPEGTGSQCASECRDTAQTGSAINTPNATTWLRPPPLCSHFPMLSPRTAAAASASSTPQETANTAIFSPGSHAAAGPTIYAIVVGIEYRTSARMIVAYPATFQKTRKPGEIAERRVRPLVKAARAVARGSD